MYVQVTATYKLLVHIKVVYTCTCICTSYCCIQVTGTYTHVGFEIHLEQNHKTIALFPDMTLSYLSPLSHTCCIPYEEACSLTTWQYSHMLLALKYKPTTSLVKISFSLLCMTYFNLFCVVHTFFGYTYTCMLHFTRIYYN